MERAELHAALLDLAREIGLRVRWLRAGGEGEPAARSGACRLNGEPLVMLAASDTVEDRVEALLAGLRAVDPARLEGRWLPPALRERLERPAPAD